MLVVCTFKWHDPRGRWNSLFTYTAEHVNRLYRGVSRNLRMPHKFVCITDDAKGIDPGVEIIPLWRDLRHLGGCYTRLKAFSFGMGTLIGRRFVWMDLDSVVVGSLDPLFSRTEDFIIWNNKLSRGPYCASMVMMDSGARPQVWYDFDPNKSPKWAHQLGFVGTDQAWIAARLGPKEAVWTPSDGVLSRWHVPKARALPGRTWRKFGTHPGALPPGARVVFWHGPVDPSLPGIQKQYPWIAEHWV